MWVMQALLHRCLACGAAMLGLGGSCERQGHQLAANLFPAGCLLLRRYLPKRSNLEPAIDFVIPQNVATGGMVGTHCSRRIRGSCSQRCLQLDAAIAVGICPRSQFTRCSHCTIESKLRES